MTLLLGMDFTPLEEYETSPQQKRDAALHAATRVNTDELLEICQMFGLIEPSPKVEPAPENTVEYCRHGHVRTPENTYIGKKDGWRRCLTCMRNHKSGQNR